MNDLDNPPGCRCAVRGALPKNSNRAPRVLVVGGGAAGIAAAHTLLGAGLEVVIAEAGRELGGNCFQVEVDGERIDAGVSDFNRTTFVRFAALLDELGVDTAPIGETASVIDEAGDLLWSSRSGSLELGEAARLGRAAARRLDVEIERFAREAPEVLGSRRPATVGEYLAARGYSPAFLDLYLGPRASGAFPMPPIRPAAMDIGAVVGFFAAHGLVGSAPRRRERVAGGMGAYVRAFARSFERRGGALSLATRVVEIRRSESDVRVVWRRAGRLEQRRFDRVVIAAGPEIATAILDVDAGERRILRSHPTQVGRLVVHRDRRLLPADPRTWGAFNYVASRRARPASITFAPRLLAGSGPDDVFVTLDPVVEPRAGLIIAERSVPHPLARRARRVGLCALQGNRRAYVCGAVYAAPHVHEQAITSGVEAARHLLADLTGERQVAQISAA